jgi:hypothetical protein
MPEAPLLVPPPATSKSIYLFAVIGMIVVGLLVALVVLWLRPNADPLIIVGGIMAAIAPTTLALLAYLQSSSTHDMVNSRLTDFIVQSSAIARQQGHVQGVADEAARSFSPPAPPAPPAV